MEKGREIPGRKREKKLISKTQFNIIRTLKALFYCYVGKKIADFKTRRDASQGRKSKAGGEKIKSDSIIYTPELIKGHESVYNPDID